MASSGYYMSRPATAPASTVHRFDTSGVMARPAGIAGLFAASGGGAGSSFSYGSTLTKSIGKQEHALRRHSPYSVVINTGWTPVEASVCPTAAMTGAGVVSAGSIDNTYTPQPLMNAWGKAREMARNEIKKPPRKQSTDLLIVAKGGQMPAPAQGIMDMGSVRPSYSKMIPLFHPIDPQRCEAGFVRSPNIIPGAQPPPVSPWNPKANFPTLPADWKLHKLYYDQTSAHNSRIPVNKVIRAEPVMPPAVQQRFLATAAGMPGGLALIPAQVTMARPQTAA
jgi:hypothetical protein